MATDPARRLRSATVASPSRDPTGTDLPEYHRPRCHGTFARCRPGDTPSKVGTSMLSASEPACEGSRMHDLEQSGFSEFDRWLALAHRTRELLDAVLGEGVLPDGGAAYLSDR